jgi:hypothetical protein
MGSFTIMQFLFQVNRVKNALNTTYDVTHCTLISIKWPFNPVASGSSWYFLYSCARGLTFKQAQTLSIIAVCGNTCWLFLILKLSSWKKEWTSLIAFINGEFLTRCLLSIINRTRAFLKFKMAARQIFSRLLYLKAELFSWPLQSVKRKPLLAQLINYHNNKVKNVYSILPCLREMNRINRHFVYISIDTTYNRFPYIIVFVKRWFITIFIANVNVSGILLRLVWNC